MKTGYILIIDNKVYFVYYKLEKPKEEDYVLRSPKNPKSLENEFKYYDALEKYYDSKQEVNVSNIIDIYEWYDEIIHPDDWHKYEKDKYLPKYGIDISGKKDDIIRMAFDRISCKAKIKDNKATIVKLI